MSEYDDIRSYDAQDMRPVFDELLADPQFLAILPHVMGDMPVEVLRAQLYDCKDPLDFQRKFIYPLVRKVMEAASNGLDTDASALPEKSSPHTYISNHRDIVLDSALLSEQLVELGFPTTPEIAIGDNLLIYPWIRHVVRLNKAFVVQRSLGLRETLIASQHMSRYMHHVIREKKNPIWIAQREGRAKDSDDRTQESVLKMIAMGGDGTILENLREMDIVPLTISYEFDPCDFLKAKEFQLKRDNPDYKKTREDDLLNMKTGIFGFKGRVHYRMGTPVNQWLDELEGLPKGEFFAELARRIDKEIFRGYRLYPSNLLAMEALSEGGYKATTCTAEERKQFHAYLEGQLAKIDLPNPDLTFLRECILKMYANPAINYHATLTD